MSLKTIAEKTGVSPSTVSRVLNGTAKISDAVRARVFDVAREVGYLDDRARKGMQGALRSLAVAVPEALLAPSDTNYVSWTIFDGLRKAAAERGIALQPIVSEGDKLDPKTVPVELRKMQCDGIVVFDENPQVLKEVARLRKPTVLLAGQDPSMHIPSVGIGNRYGARLGTDYLLGLGHRRIGLLTWKGRYTIRQREDGYREAMEQAGAGTDVFCLSGFNPALAEQEILGLIASGRFQGLSALFCLADNVALAAMRALAKSGYSVPGDLSILGFDDAVAGELTRPPLSTVHAPLLHIGPAALDELEHQYRNNRTGQPVRRIELGCSLAIRDSCKEYAA
ncbi:LacI family DNA-binding transcriptional regulator [Roseibium salinum]|uniref:LacI family DNA-binding transcriptional regulator n=1 Tax=Roseibium salinum TaxID=1604349 RepID=UPI003612B459